MLRFAALQRLQIPGGYTAIDGNWKVTIDSPMGPLETLLAIKSEGDTFTAILSGQGQTAAVSDGRLAGDAITWSNEITKPMRLRLEFTGTLKDDAMSGKVRAGLMGSFAFTGVRTG